jgi:preprotein translocase subunit SecY
MWIDYKESGRYIAGARARALQTADLLTKTVPRLVHWSPRGC